MHIDFTRGRALISDQARGVPARLALAARGEPAAATGIAWAAIALVRLFLGGAVGLADNSNGHRLLCQLGVAAHPLAAGQQLLSFVVPRYDAYTWFGEACSAGGSGQPFLSTEYFPLLYAKAATWVFGLPAALDLRMLGVVFALVVGVAVGWTVRELPGPTWARVALSSLIGLAAVDSAIAPYYISPYTQPAVLIGLLLLIPALLRLFRRDRLHASDILIVAAVTLWTLWADPQTWSLLLVIVPVLLLRPSLRPSGRAPWQWRFARTARVLRAVASRAPALAACAVLFAASVGYQATQSRWLDEAARYDLVFHGILGHSSDVRGDLGALRLPADFASAAGSTIVSQNAATTLADYPVFLRAASHGDILGFYATHPLRLFGLADRGLDAVAAARPTYLGNYPADSGAQPQQLEYRVFVATALFALAEPFRWIVLPALWIAAIAVGIRLMRRRALPARARGVGIVLCAIASAAIIQFWTVLLGEGESDLTMHLAPTIFATMLLGPLFLAALAAADQRRPSSFAGASHRVPAPHVKSAAEETAAASAKAS